MKFICAAPALPEQAPDRRQVVAPAGAMDLVQEHAVLARMLGCVQQRMTSMASEFTRKAAQQQAEIIRLRAEVIIRDTALAVARQYQESRETAEADLQMHLAAADWVICQTGCISHGEYWRVQDQCRRTGKACVLLQVKKVEPDPDRKQEDATLSRPAVRV